MLGERAEQPTHHWRWIYSSLCCKAEGWEAKSLSPRVSLAGNGFLTRFTQSSLEPAHFCSAPKDNNNGELRRSRLSLLSPIPQRCDTAAIGAITPSTKHKSNPAPSLAPRLRLELTQSRKIHGYGEHIQCLREGRVIASWDPSATVPAPATGIPAGGAALLPIPTDTTGAALGAASDPVVPLHPCEDRESPKPATPSLDTSSGSL